MSRSIRITAIMLIGADSICKIMKKITKKKSFLSVANRFCSRKKGFFNATAFLDALGKTKLLLQQIPIIKLEICIMKWQIDSNKIYLFSIDT